MTGGNGFRRASGAVLLARRVQGRIFVTRPWYNCSAGGGRGNGATSARLNLAPPAVEDEGHYGRFSCRAVPSPRQVWIAGGVGVTPFLGMARDVDRDGDTAHDVDLYYCTERPGEDYFIDELYGIADRDPRLRVIPVRWTSLGFITAVDIKAVSPDLANQDILICGPPVMLRNLTRQFLALGVAPERIHFEDFAALAR